MTAAIKKGCDLTRFQKIWGEIQDQPPWRAQADREADYYDGNQLDSELLQAQQAKGIPPAIENLIGRTVNDVLGIEAKNRKDFRVVPESEQSCDDVAEALNQKLNLAERESKADRACTDAHASQVKVGLGWVEVARERDPFKYPYRCRSIHRNEIWWDMKSTEPDLSDALWLVRRKWTDTDVAALLFPAKKDLIKRVGSGSGAEYLDLATLSLEGGSDTGLLASLDIDRGWTMEESEWRDYWRNRLCLFEVLTRHYKKALVLKMGNGRVVEFNRKDPLHCQAVAVGMPLVPATVSDIYQTYFLGPYQLHSEKLPYTHGFFPYVPFWGEKEDRTGIPYGMIRDLMFLQDEVNARISRMQWGMAAIRSERTEGAVKMSDKAFRETIARPDADVILDKTAMRDGGIFKVERDYELNAQQYNRLMDLRDSINRVSGVSEAFKGTGGSDTFSGLNAQIEQTVQSLAMINLNFEFSRQMVGHMLLSLIIEDCQEEEEVIVKGGLVKDDRVVVLNAVTHDTETGIEYKNNDVARTQLKVSLSDVPSTPSFRQQQLSALSEAFKSAPPQFQNVMMPHLMNLMDVPNKEEIVTAIREISKAPTPEEIEQRVKDEIQKALSESNRDLKQQEVDIKARKTDAEIEKIMNESVNRAVDAMYSAMQAAGVIAATPATAPLGDQLLKSAGFEDKDKPPIVPSLDVPATREVAVPGMPHEPAAMPEIPSNTNPTTPVPVPEPAPEESAPPPMPNGGYAGEGQAAGIETPEIEL